MRRRYTPAEFAERVARIEWALPANLVPGALVDLLLFDMRLCTDLELVAEALVLLDPARKPVTLADLATLDSFPLVGASTYSCGDCGESFPLAVSDTRELEAAVLAHVRAHREPPRNA